jgi:hypothetical protein
MHDSDRGRSDRKIVKRFRLVIRRSIKENYLQITSTSRTACAYCEEQRHSVQHWHISRCAIRLKSFDSCRSLHCHPASGHTAWGVCFGAYGAIFYGVYTQQKSQETRQSVVKAPSCSPMSSSFIQAAYPLDPHPPVARTRGCRSTLVHHAILHFRR